MFKKSGLLLHLLNFVLVPRQATAPAKQPVTSHQLPPAHDRGAWRAYWQAQGQPWRTEPEIDEKCREYMAGRRSILLDIEHGIYPFKDIKLCRADVEWLLATHENGRGQ